MSKIRTLLLGLLASASFASAANAITYDLNASADGSAVLSDFRILFSDADNNGLLNISEVLTFSGVDCAFCDPRSNPLLQEVPQIPGFRGRVYQLGIQKFERRSFYYRPWSLDLYHYSGCWCPRRFESASPI